MAARFEVDRAFDLEERGLFVLAGSMSEGMVRVGMTATLEGDDGAFSRPVHGVEFLEEAGPEPCLTFHCRDRERMEEWLAMGWEGRTLSLTW